jgi:hypothetical protein
VLNKNTCVDEGYCNFDGWKWDRHPWRRDTIGMNCARAHAETTRPNAEGESLAHLRRWADDSGHPSKENATDPSGGQLWIFFEKGLKN